MLYRKALPTAKTWDFWCLDHTTGHQEIADAPVDPDHGQAGLRPSRGATELVDREAMIDVLADLRDPRKQVEEGIKRFFKKLLDEEDSDTVGGLGMGFH